MNKQRLSSLFLPAALLIFSAALQAQKLTVDDLVNLKDMGFSVQDIQAEIASSGVVELTAADLDQLREKGVSPELISSLGTPRAAAPAEAPAAPAQLAVAPADPQPAAAPTAEPKAEAVAGPVVEPATPAPAKPTAPAEPEIAKPAEDQPLAVAAGAAEDEFVQPALPAAPKAPEPPIAPVGPGTLAPPAPVPAPVPAPRIVQPQAPAPVPKPAVTVAGTTPHRMEAGKTAAFNLPYNNTGEQAVTVVAIVFDDARMAQGRGGSDWLSVSPGSTRAQPGGSASFRVQLSSMGLSPGTYKGGVYIKAEGRDSRIEYPFTLTVTPGARPGPQLVQPIPGPAPVPGPAPGPAPYSRPAPGPGSGPAPSAYPGPSAYRDPWADRDIPIRGYEQPQYGQGSELTGEWAAVIPGAWGMQTILYLEVGYDGSYGYSVLQNNQITEYSSGRLSAQGGMLQATTDEGESLAYGYSRIGNQLIINMPEWGGNVAFYPQ